jgi:hypothetical protein
MNVSSRGTRSEPQAFKISCLWNNSSKDFVDLSEDDDDDDDDSDASEENQDRQECELLIELLLCATGSIVLSNDIGRCRFVCE